MLSKSKIAIFFIFLVFIFHLEVFALTPFSIVETVLNTVFLIMGFTYLLIYPKYFDKGFKKWLYAFLGLMLVSIVTSHQYLGQNILSGIIGNIAILKLGSVIFAYYLMRRYRIATVKLVAIVKNMGWVLFVFYLWMFIGNIHFTFTSVFTGSTVQMGVGKLDNSFINFSSILYLGSFFYRGKTKYLVFSLILFSSNMLEDFQRFASIAYIITLASGIFFSKNKRTILKFVPYTLLIILMSLFLFSYSDYGVKIQDKFESAFTIFEFDAGASNDSSVNVRVLEAEYALKEFSKHPVLGNGKLREENISKTVGDLHFYLSDIGLVGVLYVFGLLGILVYLFQVGQFTKMRIFSDPSMGLKLYMIFILFFTLLTGATIYKPGAFFIILMLYLFEIKQQNSFKNRKYHLLQKNG